MAPIKITTTETEINIENSGGVGGNVVSGGEAVDSGVVGGVVSGGIDSG